MEWFFCSMILVASLLQAIATNTKVYCIHPTNHNLCDFTDYTLQGYINHTKMQSLHNYSKSKLFLPSGKHFLQTHFVVKNASNFSIHGNNSIIYCEKPFIGIVFIEVRHVMLNNIEIINCGATYINKKAGTQDNSAVYLSGCTDVNMYGISIMVHSGTSGIVAININASNKNKTSIFRYITITTSCIKASLPSSGILFCYLDYYSKIDPRQYINEVHLSNYKYKTIGLCNASFALYIATNQTKFSVLIKILDTNLN